MRIESRVDQLESSLESVKDQVDSIRETTEEKSNTDKCLKGIYRCIGHIAKELTDLKHKMYFGNDAQLVTKNKFKK